MNGPVQRASVHVLLPLTLVVAVLYLAKDFFIPLALAVLISFLLAPVIRWLEKLRIGRITSVLTVTVFAFSIIGALGYVIGGQLIDLANELPNYKSNLQEKVAAFRTTKDSPLTKATETLREVTDELAEQEPESTAPTPEPDAQTTAGPISPQATTAPVPEGNSSRKARPDPSAVAVPVKVVYSSSNALDTLKSFVGPLIGPLGVAALVIVFVIFFLLQLEDLRDRVIHLIGRGHLRVTTQALDEAGRRVSRYLLAQLIVNVTYGIPVGVGLYFIGIPNAVLWGMLATVLRFIPYIGPWIGAAFPIFLSLAVSSSWNTPLLTLGLFLVLEIISNNVVEPWLYGSSTGLSPVAVITAAAFWTWLWGPIGLLLATPLTVCLAVLGKYIPALSFIDVLIGDRPPIAMEDRFYQRLLAGDEEEICEIAETHAEKHSLVETFETIIIPALRMAEIDYRAGVLPESTRDGMHDLVRGLIERLDEEEVPRLREQATEEPVAVEGLKGDGDDSPAVFCLPACNKADELTGLMLARILAQHGVAAKVCASKMLTSEMVQQVLESSTRVICVSVLPPGSVLPAALVCRRLRAKLPDARIAVGLWDQDALDSRRRKRFQESEADVVYTSLEVASRELASQVRQTMTSPLPEQEAGAK